MNKSKQNGISMISLVIIVIVLLILATITFDFVVNKNIFKKTENAKNQTENYLDEQQQMQQDVRNLYR